MIYNIESGQPFLENLLQGYLKRYSPSPITLARTRFFLPNKRAGRELFKLFALKENSPQIIPKITSIGEFESEDESLILSHIGEATLTSPLMLRVIIAKLLQNKLLFYKNHSKESFSLAASLESFYLELIKEEIDLLYAKEVFITELNGVNNKLLDHLMIVLEDLPIYLKDNNLIDPISYRYTSLNLIANLWEKIRPDFPIIIAAPNEFSSSICNFLNVVNNLNEGNVVFKNLSSEVYTAPLHFRTSYSELFEKLNLDIQNITPWNETNFPTLKSRNLDFSERLFQSNIFTQDLAKENIPEIEVIACKNEFETASSISIYLKRDLDQNLNTTLVTQDSNLRRKVKINLTQWNIKLDDSSGVEINKTPLGSFLQLCLHLIKENFSDLAIISLLKHPYSGLGYRRADLRRKVRQFELYERSTNILYKPSLEDKIIIKNSLFEATSKFTQLLKKSSPLKDLLQEHLNFAYQLSHIITDGDDHQFILWKGEEGKQIKEFFDELQLSLNKYGSIEGKAYYEIYNNLIFNQVIRKSVNLTGNLHILSPDEAHLLTFDHVIIADLEDNLLDSLLSSPWLNLRLRAKLNLRSSEKLIREDNEIMFNLLSSNRVTIFHSKQKQGKIYGEPQFLLKIKALLDKVGFKPQIYSSPMLIEWIKKLSLSDKEIKITAPTPYINFALKNNKITITQVQKLMQDPYAFYAEEILNLKKISNSYRDYLILEFGIFIHKVIHLSLINYSGQNNWEKQIIDIAIKEIEKLSLEIYIQEIWLHKAKRISMFLGQNLQINGKILSETKGNYALNSLYSLEAKADLIIENDNMIQIIDFKTGLVPPSRLIEYGLYPQLPLESLIIERLGFKEITNPKLEKDLIYIRITGQEPAGEIIKLKNPSNLVNQAEQGLSDLINLFSSENQPFISAPYYDNNIYAKDYLHLSRLKEWKDN